MEPVINKLADFQDMNQVARSVIIARLLKTRHVIEQTGLAYTWHMMNHWLRLWEYSGAIIGSHLDKRMVVLDAGGTGTIFSYYMALEGCEVHTIDPIEEKIGEADELSQRLGVEMYHSAQVMEDMNYVDEYFDAVYSISVIEHIRPDLQPLAILGLARVLKPGGIIGLTFDYGSEGAGYPMLSAEDVWARLVIPSRLNVIGNKDFYADSSDLHNTTAEHTFGSLFLKKPGKLSLQKRVPVISNPVFDSCHASMNYYAG